jgi:outer membrane protein assembly factor BamB/TolA-binding protein
MTNDEFLARALEQGVLSEDRVAKLRAQIAKSPKPVSTKALAKHLVDGNILTFAQAKALLAVPVPVEPVGPAADAEQLEMLELEPLEESKPETPQPAGAETAKPATQRTPASLAPAASSNSLVDELSEFGSPAPVGASPLDLLSSTAATATDGGALLDKPKRRGLGGMFAGKEPKKRKPGESEWDSPLLFIGGGALLFMLLLGGGVYFLYVRGNSDQQFSLAEKDYREGAYTQAIAKYTQYLDKFPNDTHASKATVYRGLAKLRQATEHGSNYSHALEVAQSVVREIENEKDFHEARPEFQTLFPGIAEGLAKEAVEQKDSEGIKKKLDEAEKALTLVMNTNYVPKSNQPVQKITSIREVMAIATRELDRETELTKTLEAMREAAKGRDIAAAYGFRKNLLKSYPDLQDNKLLAEAVLSIAEGEKGAVQRSKDLRNAETGELPSPVVAQVAVATRLVATQETSGPVAAVLVRGAVYTFDSGNGKLLWRRYVGSDATTPPVALGSDADADLLLIDSSSQALLRVAAKSGELVWRQPLGERISGAAMAGKQLVLSTQSGRVLAIDADTGKAMAAVTLPLGARLAAGYAPTQDRIFQVGEQSTVYVLDRNLTCQQAFYLGHELGAVAVPPLVLPQHLVVAENRGAKSCVVYVLSLGEEGTIGEIEQKFEMPGHILTPPAYVDRKLVFMGDGGHIKVMGVNPSNLEQPLADLADQAAARGETPRMRHLHVNAGDLWIADNHLARYTVQSAAGRLLPSPIEDEYENATFDQPLLALGTTLIHARNPVGTPYVLVSGTKLEDGAKIWETQVATPPAGAPMVREDRVALVTMTGDLNPIAAEELKQGVYNSPASQESKKPGSLLLSAEVRLNDSTTVYAAQRDAEKILVVTSGNGQAWDSRILDLPGLLACPPASLGRGLIVPTKIGQVFWLNLANGKPVSAPFQSQVSVGSETAWTTPAATADGKELLITDGTKLFRVILSREPTPHLEAAATSPEHTEPLVTPVAVTGSIAAVADNRGMLFPYQLPSLEAATPLDLGGEVAWGPFSIEDHVLLCTVNDELICLSSTGSVAWRRSLEHGPLAGSPRFVDDHFLAIARNGYLVRFAVADGAAQGVIRVKQPLVAGPVKLGSNWLVVTDDSTVLVVNAAAEASQ